MEEVMSYLKDINWEELGNVLTNFIKDMNIPGFFTDCINFVKDLIAAIAA